MDEDTWAEPALVPDIQARKELAASLEISEAFLPDWDELLRHVRVLKRQGPRKEREQTCTDLVLHSILVLEACWSHVPEQHQQYARKRLRDLAQKIREQGKRSGS